ncbi:hypothetical protein F7734_32680 [Scytonema sp. UIC 10036]|uniref:hypothetical protein n=1 Tax=Scytonema sp. UIC 10036 TaxID=2304196 RepID=UPI0012DAAC53|nr:hypothetical protein [Scytonema sp. UIC 10036]MUG96843.1 hypothetical protein [Scytonema sp. UIC 10036]
MMLEQKKKYNSVQIKNISKKYAVYRDAIHALLYEHPKGVSEAEIVSQLEISQSDCQELLYFGEFHRQEIHGNVDERGILYNTRKTDPPAHSLEYELQILKQNRHPLLKFVIRFALVLLLLLVIVFFVYPYLNSSHNSAIASLNHRIEQIKLTATKFKCEWYWRSGDSCYVNGRLLTKTQFQQEFKNFLQ